MADTLNIGIIGCGGIANGKHMPALKTLENEDVRMTAFCDIVPAKAQSAQAQYGAEGSKVYDTYQELIADPAIDVVHVLTPNNSHAEISIAALEAGKHVNSEKPMAKVAADALKMAEAAERTGKKLTISYQTRFKDDSQYLYNLCREGDLGDIYYAEAIAVRRRAVPTWGVFLDGEKQGGGPLIDIVTHSLDLTLWLMNNYKPKVALGQTFHKLSQRENAANAWGPWDPKEFTVEDSGFGMVVMENGATIMIKGAWALNIIDTEEATCVLAGTEGGADFRKGLRINGEKRSRLYDETVNFGSGGVAFYGGSSSKPEVNEARSWVNAIRTNTDPMVMPRQALVVSQILEALYTSARTGEAVTF